LHWHEVKGPIAAGRSGTLALAMVAMLCVWPAPSSAAPTRSPAPTDAEIRSAMRRGLDYVYSRPRDAGNWQSRYAARYPGGVEALVALTTLEADQQQADKARLGEVIGALDRAQIETVYGRSLRAMVYARLPAETHGARLEADVKWLIDNQQPNGGWGYGPGHPTTRLRRNWTDSSNSQFATMALRRAAGAGADVPPGVWRRCGDYWRAAQNADGGWGYEPQGPPGSRLRAESYGSMTAAGVASLLALSGEAARTARDAGARRNPLPDGRAISRGLEWLAGNYSLAAAPGWVYGRGDEWLYYYLFALVRAADSAGLRAFADRDFFADLAVSLLGAQGQDGSWPVPAVGEPADATVRTCLALLALARARRPVMMNRLSLGDPWETDCRDAAHLAEWFSQRFASPTTWQLLSPARPDWVEALGDSPVLYINTHGGAELSESIKAPLREFVRSGGTILVQPFGGDEKSAAQARSFFARLFPKLTERKLDARHPVFKLHFQIPPDKQPKGTHLGDTLRSRVFILTTDLSGAWHQNEFRRSPEAFEFAANVVLYATDKLGLPGRFSARRSPPPAPAPRRWIDIARVRHPGDWDICPRAAARLTEVLAEALSLGVREAEPVSLDEDVPGDVTMLWITGTAGPALTGEQVRRIETYVRRGGTVFVDSAMGGRRFFQDVRTSLEGAFGADAFQRLDRSSPLITGRFAGGMGSDLSQVRYSRTVAAKRPRLRAPELWGIELDGRVAVILSPYGIICPVEGLATFGCRGLHSDDARRLAANVVLYAASR